MRFAGDALNHDNYGQHTVDGQQRLVEPAKPNTYPQVVDTPAHLTGQPGFDTMDLKKTPEITAPIRPVFMPGQAPAMDLLKDKYILKNPASGVG